MRIPTVLAAFAVAVPAHVAAQSSPNGWTIGLTTFASQSPYIGDKNNVSLIPTIRYTAKSFTLGTDGLTIPIVQDAPFTATVFAEPRFSTLAMSDDPALSGINRNITGDIGLSTNYALARATNVTLSAQTEFTGDHGGTEISLDISQGFLAGSLPVQISLGASWQSAELANHLYGVAQNETAPGRPAYALGSAIIPGISLSTRMSLGPSTTAFATAGYNLLPSEIANSPIIARSQEATIGGGLLYNF